MSATRADLSVPIVEDPRKHWLNRGRDIAQRLSTSRWELGDWWRDGDGSLDAVTVGDQIGVTHTRIYLCAWIARTFPPQRRRHQISHTHHTEVAGLPTTVADALLDQAVAERWPVARIREAVRAARRELDIEAQRVAHTAQRELTLEAAAWQVDARRLEHEFGERLTAAAAAARSIVDAARLLAEHPGRAGVHGNRRRALVQRLRRAIDAGAVDGIDLEQVLSPLLAQSRSRPHDDHLLVRSAHHPGRRPRLR